MTSIERNAKKEGYHAFMTDPDGWHEIFEKRMSAVRAETEAEIENLNVEGRRLKQLKQEPEKGQ